MSVIQKIRDKGAWIMFSLIALALIAFILQDRALGGGHGSFFGGNTTAIGKVNGTTIERAEFERKLTLYASNGSPREQLIGQLWTAEVNNIVMQQEYDKLGLVCSSKELSEAIFSETSPLRREFTDPQTGQFNEANARKSFEQLKKSKNKEQQQAIGEIYVQPMEQQSLQNKYQALLQQSMYVPKWLIEKTKADNNGVAAVSYVYVPYSSVADTTVKVTDDEIMAYAKKHKKEYEKEDETRSISFVGFDATASAADSATALNNLLSLKNELASTTDVKTFIAKVGTELPYNDGYINRKEIKQKSIDSIAKLPVGGIYGPYIDVNNYVLAKQIGTKMIPDSAKVRHILVATHQPNQQSGSLEQVRDDSTAKKIMDTVQMELKAGKNFDSVCAKYSDDGNKNKGGVYDYFPSGKMVPTFNEFAFEKPVGSKGVVKTEYGYHYIEVLGQKGSSPAYKIAYLAKPILVSNETDNNAQNAALQFAANSRNKKQFDENAVKQGKTVLPANEIKEMDFSITGLGESRQLVRWAYEHGVGDITEQPVRVGNRYIIAILLAVSKPGLPNVGLLRPTVEALVRNEKKAQQIINNKFKGNTLEALATSTGSTVQKTDSLLFSNPFIPGVGNDAKFTGAAFNKSMKGKVTEAIAGTSGVFALRVENSSSKPVTNDNDAAIKQTLTQSQRVAVYRGMEALKNAATIKDNRSKFF